MQLSKELQARLLFVSDMALQVLQRNAQQTVGYSGIAPYPIALSGEMATERKADEEWVDNYLKQIEPELKQQAEALFRSSVREAMLQGGNVRRLKEAIKRGVKPKIVRKRQIGGRDPLFIQIGDGIAEEMEEVYLLG